MWQLTTKVGKQRGASWPIGESPLLLGRGRHCEIVIRDPSVSREHGRVWLSQGVVRFEDLGSSNGSIVNGKPVRDSQLFVGDELMLGDITFVVSRIHQSGETDTPTHVRTTISRLGAPRLHDARLTPSGRNAAPRNLYDLYALHELNMFLSACATSGEVVRAVLDFGLETFRAKGARWVAESELSADTPVDGLDTSWCKALLSEDLSWFEKEAEGENVNSLVAIPVRFGGVSLGVFLFEVDRIHGELRESITALAPSLSRSAGAYLRATRDLETQAAFTNDLVGDMDDQHILVGRSEAARELRRTLAMVSRTEVPIYIVGDTGTGKELCARFLHEKSERSKGPFVPLNCAAVPEELFESEFFGYEKGAFTGAQTRKPGLLAEAEGGMLFLDEISELSPRNQARLLRVMETNGYRVVGATKESHSNVWVVSASNTDLLHAVERGAFREDLYYRLSVIEVEVPPLSDRREDIPLLVERFASDGPTGGQSTPLLDEQGIQYLSGLDWPGNVRELKNLITRAATLGSRRPVPLSELTRLGERQGRRNQSAPSRVDEMEKAHIERILEQCGGRMGQAAERLGIHRNTLRRKLKQFGIRE